MNINNYRCRLRAYDHACAPDPALDSFVQVKARNAVEATRLAQQGTDCAVIDVERLED